MRRLWIFVTLASAWACAAAQPTPVEPAPTPGPSETPAGEAPPATALGQADDAAPPLATATTGSAAAVPPPQAASPPAAAAAAVALAEPNACPAGMVLVEGDYCTEVEHQCLQHWFDESNKKKVCEKFAPKSRCVGDKVPKRFCIDKYAWPNVAGERPEVMNNFYQAQVKCAAVGKRMCTESEWTMSCEGPEMLPFPHGYVRDARKCNGDHRWDDPDMEKVRHRDPEELARLWRGVRSGSQPECVSGYGVADLPGNNDEVVAAESPKAKFESVNTGGPWYKGVRNQCRPKIYTHDEGFYYYFLGFRCCTDPDGAAVDPRTPGQIRKKWPWASVERLAGFGVAAMRDKLELKRQGKCACSATDTKCKTMCGTLLGPKAKDGDDSTRDAPGER
jgi:sulfatase modifying factor 1